MKIFKFSSKLKGLTKKLLIALSVSVIAISIPLSAYAAPIITDYPTTYSGSYGQITSAGGSMWYLENVAHYIGKMTSSGVVTDYDLSHPSGTTSFYAKSITTGSDGNVWFNGFAPGSAYVYVGSLNITTGVVTYYLSSTTGWDSQTNLVAASDGNLWYAMKYSGLPAYTYMKKVNPSTGVTSSGRTLSTYSDVESLTSGPDGDLWYIDSYYQEVISFAPGSGTIGGAYLIPSSSGTYSSDIISGSDGNVWFIESGKIVKVTTSGVFTQYTPSGTAANLAAGPDGAVWFADNSGTTKKIGRITTAGSITEYNTTGSIGGIVAGPGNLMWYTNSTSSGNNYLSTITTDPFFTNNPISTSYGGAHQMINLGGSLWYIDGYDYIGKMTTSGVVADYNVGFPSGTTGFLINSITAGPDGNVWFNGRATNVASVYSGFLNTTTGDVTFYFNTSSYDDPTNIVAGSDGDLWYAAKYAGLPAYTYLIKIDPATGLSGTGHTFGTSNVITSLTSGPDGRIWATDANQNAVYAVSVSTGTATAYSIPTSSSNPYALSAGPDGNVWFVESSYITKLTPTGSFTEYSLPSGANPKVLSSGSDGAVWFTDDATSTKKIGRISTSGVVTEYAPPTGGTVNPNGLTVGPDGAMWFSYSDSSGTGLGRLGY